MQAMTGKWTLLVPSLVEDSYLVSAMYWQNPTARAGPVVTSCFHPRVMGDVCKRRGGGRSYQGRLLGLWGAGRAVRGGWTAPVTGIGHVPICQGLKRRQSVLIHRDAVQGLCKHCQQVGLIFFIYLLRRGEGGETEAEKQT